MPARYQQGETWLRERSMLQLIDGYVCGKMVDAEQRLVQRERVSLGRRHPDEQRPGKTRPGGDSYCVQVGERNPGLSERPIHRRDHGFQVRPTRDLRYHAAEPGVLVHTRRHGIGQQSPAADNPHPGLVTRGLDAEHEWLVGHEHRPYGHTATTSWCGGGGMVRPGGIASSA